LTFGAAGGEGNKHVCFYKAAKDEISGSISSMRGDSIGTVIVDNAFDSTQTLTFDANANSELFQTFKSYFTSGRQTLILYQPTTRGTYSGGYCYDYLSITAATLTFNFDYLQSDGSMASASVAAGSAARLNITAYNSAYTHRVTWKFGSYSNTQTVSAGTAYASYTIPLTWLNAIPSATSGSASATLETLDASGNVLGTSTHGFTITAPTSIVPSIGSITASPVNDNSAISGWGIYVYGKSKAKLTMASVSGTYGSTIKSYSITTSPNVGSATASTVTTGYLYQTGTITVTAKVTDSRGRTASKTTTFSVYGYSAPYYSSVTVYRCNSSGTRDDTGGTYAYLNVSFGCSTLSGSNTVTGSVTLTQVGGSYSQTASLTSGIGRIMGSGSLAVDATYNARLTLTDTVGTVSVYDITIPSAAYVMHVKKGGKAIGFGTAAGDDNTVTFGWPVKLVSPLGIDQGGTGGSTAAAARANLGAVSKTGDTMTGDLTFNQFGVKIKGDWRYLDFLDDSGNIAFRFLMMTTSGNHNMHFMQRAKDLSQYEIYHLPTVASSLSVNADYSFLTTKNLVSIVQGGTGASSAKAALNNLGIFYADTLPSSGTDGQICLVPV